MNISTNSRLTLVVFIVLFLSGGCADSKKEKKEHTPAGTGKATPLAVAAAANLRNVLEDLQQQYLAENPLQQINITYGSSGMLVQQILSGAPFDLFLSADNSYPEKLKKEGKAQGNSMIYAYGKVVLWSSKMDVTAGLSTVKKTDIKKIAIANPELAPYGANSVAALQHVGLYQSIEKKIVWGENISQTAQFVASGNADLGFIALSQALSDEMIDKGTYYELSEAECSPIAQSGIVIKGRNKMFAQEFLNYIISKKQEVVWKRFGYGITKK